MVRHLLVATFLMLPLTVLAAALPPAPARPRARDLGIRIGILPPGPANAITDVAGVRVGHSTLVEGDDVRTGVTVILPHDGDLFREKVPAAVVVANGFGKLTGITQVHELGTLETPIALTVDPHHLAGRRRSGDLDARAARKPATCTR